MFWKKFPFIRLSVVLAAGILIGFFFRPVVDFVWIATTYLLAFSSVFIAGKKIPYKFRWIPGSLMLILLLLLSFKATELRYLNIRSGNLKFNGHENLFIADISEHVVPKKNSVKVIADIKAVYVRGEWKRVKGKMLVYVRKDTASLKLFYGDRIVFRTKPSEPSPPVNPGGFDARKYYSFKGIYLQAYLPSGKWKKLDHETGNPFIYLAMKFRNTLLEIFRSNGLQGREFGVASALLLGYTDEIDQHLIGDYSATGAMHILSVSGMHVGVIFIFLEKLLSFLNRNRRRMLIKYSLMISCIWLYAMLTGLSPAVLRAAAMISLVIIGSSLRRHTEILNILGISFFFLILYDPGLLFDTGFLLSYIAVGGIVILNKPIKDFFTPTNKPGEKIWSLVAVSIAAQLATLPMCLFYFHQFPNYFILTNIVVVPLSNVVIYLGIFCLVFGTLPFISVFLIKGLFWSVKIMNGFIHFIAELPFSVTTGINLSLTESLLLYLVLITIVAYGMNRKKTWFFISLATVNIFLCSLGERKYEELHSGRIIFYSSKGSFLADFIEGNESIIAGDLKSLDDDFFFQSVNANHRNNGITTKLSLLMIPRIKNDNVLRFGDTFIKSSHFIDFCGKRTVIVNNKPVAVMKRIKAEIVVISGSPRFKLIELLNVYETRNIIIDASNPVYKVKQWQKEADSLHVTCHSLKFDGAFILNF